MVKITVILEWAVSAAIASLDERCLNCPVIFCAHGDTPEVFLEAQRRDPLLSISAIRLHAMPYRGRLAYRGQGGNNDSEHGEHPCFQLPNNHSDEPLGAPKAPSQQIMSGRWRAPCESDWAPSWIELPVDKGRLLFKYYLSPPVPVS